MRRLALFPKPYHRGKCRLGYRSGVQDLPVKRLLMGHLILVSLEYFSQCLFPASQAKGSSLLAKWKTVLGRRLVYNTYLQILGGVPMDINQT